MAVSGLVLSLRSPCSWPILENLMVEWGLGLRRIQTDWILETENDLIQFSSNQAQPKSNIINRRQMQVKSKSNTNSNQRGIREPPKSSEMFETKCLRLWDIERVTRDVQRSQRVNQNSSQPSTSSRSKSRENLSSVASSSTKQARTDWSNDQWETANRKIVTSQLRKTDNQLRFSWAN